MAGEALRVEELVLVHLADHLDRRVCEAAHERVQQLRLVDEIEVAVLDADPLAQEIPEAEVQDGAPELPRRDAGKELVRDGGGLRFLLRTGRDNRRPLRKSFVFGKPEYSGTPVPLHSSRNKKGCPV